MADFVNRLIGQTGVPALEQLMRFTAARHEVLVNNIANIDLPGYRVQDLSVADFQQALAKALENRGTAGGPLVLAGRQVRSGPDGRLMARPQPAEGFDVVFGDQANRQVEREMAALAENTLTHNVAAELLRFQFNQVRTAIRQKL
jgi:flagellar basal-body rod protein FlgB